ncbi:flowering time control protein FPA-like [Rutidosis leptorrhynchoides]|uniref:flowering time control protein FPA-like n=1 Tax=Rutidosis leptorrhynchoides TaxID=125765 RepID=UPI003A99B29D
MSNNLWVGSLSTDVTKSELKNLFAKYGGVDSVSCYPSRNYAFVYLKNAEDAVKARDNLQGFVLHGSPLKIEFAKSAKPCNSLWVSGISTCVSSEELLEDFSKFGKIQNFTFQLEKRCAYVDYFSVEDASKALKGMHGKFKGGSVIRVDYSRSHSRKNILPLESQKGDEQLSNVLFISYPPTIHIDEQMLHNAMILFGEIEKIKCVPSKYCSFVEFRSVEEAQLAKDGLQGRLFNDPRILISFSINEPSLNPYFTVPTGPMPDASFQPVQLDSFGQPLVLNSFHGGSFNSILPGQDLGLGGSYPNLITPIGNLNQMSSPLSQKRLDPTTIQRDPKRLRTNVTSPLNGLNDQFLLPDQTSRGVVATNTRFTNIALPNVNYIWRGVIAKAGNHVCRARCVPVGDWIGYEIPEIVNCSARTGLDMLAKHYTDAIGFDIVYFLPDSEEDFASYTEFLQFMGDRDRAGVVKFDDGTTLFLVPPSDFLRTVLKVSGPERLYGVVLKFPQNDPDTTSGPTISQPQYAGNLQDPVTSNVKPVYSVPPVTATSASSHGLSLTPELVATLASLAKVNSNGQLVNDRQFNGQRYEDDTSNLSQPFMQKPAYLSNTVNSVNLNQHPMQAAQQYPPDYLQTDSPSGFHAGSYGVQSAKQVYGTNVNEQQSIVNSGMDISEQMQQVQSALMGANQQTSELDANKNERYQSTLQFAANLLLQIQKRSGTETDGNR